MTVKTITHIPDFFEKVSPEKFAGMAQGKRHWEIVEVDRIVGSMNRSQDYGADWRPLKPDPPWESIHKAAKEGKDPGEMSDQMPVVLYKHKGEYWIGDDGNRRVSVAKLLGRKTLKAEVIDVIG